MHVSCCLYALLKLMSTLTNKHILVTSDRCNYNLTTLMSHVYFVRLHIQTHTHHIRRNTRWITGYNCIRHINTHDCCSRIHHLRTYMYVHTYTPLTHSASHTHTHTHSNTHTYIHTYIHTYTHTRIYTYIQRPTHPSHTQTYTDTHRAYDHTHTHTHRYTALINA